MYSAITREHEKINISVINLLIYDNCDYYYVR